MILDCIKQEGVDAFLSTAQMPPGVPVATMAIGTAGAKNTAIKEAIRFQKVSAEKSNRQRFCTEMIIKSFC
jgi:phosphoribosylcarboxyaminoimidazole (NCAIR) mutase